MYFKMYRKHSNKGNNMKLHNTNTKLSFTYFVRDGVSKIWSYSLTVPAASISDILNKKKQEWRLRCNNIILTKYTYQKFKL